MGAPAAPWPAALWSNGARERPRGLALAIAAAAAILLVAAIGFVLLRRELA